MTETETMVTPLTTRRCGAASSFGGIAKSVQRARYTAGKLPHTIEPPGRMQQDALFVPGMRFASATLWKLYVLMWLLILTSKGMVSALLR